MGVVGRLFLISITTFFLFKICHLILPTIKHIVHSGISVSWRYDGTLSMMIFRSSQVFLKKTCGWSQRKKYIQAKHTML